MLDEYFVKGMGACKGVKSDAIQHALEAIYSENDVIEKIERGGQLYFVVKDK